MALLGYGLDRWGLDEYGSATPTGSLSLVSAIAISTNEVQVQLTRPPLAEAPTVLGDALNPATWDIQRLDTGEFFSPISVRALADDLFIVTVLQPFGPYYASHRVSSTTLMDDVGDVIQVPNQADYAGILDKEAKDAPTRAAKRSAAVRDVANPPTSNPSSIGGTFVINTAGDYELEGGTALLRKLIIRRLSTVKGGFFHLPDYGLGIVVKEPVPAASLIKLKAEIERQVLREPEVEEVRAVLTLGTQNDLTITLKAKLRATGEQFDLALKASPEGVLL